MNPEPQVDLAALARAKLASERLRVLCMIGLFAAFIALGAYRIVAPVEGRRDIGWLVLALSVAYLAAEVVMLRLVNAAIADERAFDRRVGALHTLVECTYPIVAMFSIMVIDPGNRYTVLVSPGYAFLMILIAVSVLRVDVRSTAWTGGMAAAGYALLVGWALTRGDAVENPHPPSMYVVLTIVLGLATAASAFVARQIQGYLAAAVRELETRRQRDRLKRDLEVAGDIQRQLLPQAAPSLAGYDIAAVNRPADETGGDYYDWQQIDPHRVVFSLGDVTGHGIGPALVSAACRAYVRALLSKGPAMADVLSHANRLLHADLADGRFVTLALVDLDAQQHVVRLLSAGHGPTFHVSAHDGRVERIDAQGLPLGLMEDAPLDDAVEVRLAAGDIVLLCSDGFFEPANAADEIFGLARLEAALRTQRGRPAAAIVAAIENAVAQFTAGTPQPDDMTALLIKRQA